MRLTNILKKYGLFIFLTAVFWTVALRFIPLEFCDLGGDSAQYIILAESISRGMGLRMVNYPGEPFSPFAPALSLLLAPILYFFGRNFWLMNFIIIFLSYLSLILFYKLFLLHSEKTIAFLIIIFLSLDRFFCFYNTRILTEIPFLFFVAFTLYFIAKYKDKQTLFNKEGFLALAGLISAYLCRSIGALLFFVALFNFCIEDKARKAIQFKKALFLFIGFLPIFLFWNLRNLNIHNRYVPSLASYFVFIDAYRPYLGLITDKPFIIILRFIKGANFYFYKIGETIFPYFMNKFHSPFFLDAFSLLAIIVAFAGLITEIRNRKYAWPFYFLIYFLLISLWPFFEDGRYIIPILPFVFFYFFVGIKRILGFLCKSRFAYIVFFIFAFCLLIFNTIFIPLQRYRRYTYQDIPMPLKNFISVHRWIKGNLSQEGIILSRKPTITYFYTNHKAIVYPFTFNPDEIWQEIIGEDVKYIIADEFSWETYLYLVPFFKKYSDRLKFLHREGNTGVFEVSLRE